MHYTDKQTINKSEYRRTIKRTFRRSVTDDPCLQCRSQDFGTGPKYC